MVMVYRMYSDFAKLNKPTCEQCEFDIIIVIEFDYN